MTVRVHNSIVDAEGNETATGEIPLTLRPRARRRRPPPALPRRRHAVEPRRPPPLHVHDDRHGRRLSARRGDRPPSASGALQLDPRPRPADQRRDRQAARRVRPPRQRPDRSGHDRPGRGAPGRAAEGGRLQRDPQRAQPGQSGDARRRATASGCSSWTRPSTCGPRARRDHDYALRFAESVGARSRRDGPQGPQPPERDHVLDRQRDPRDRHRRSAPRSAATWPSTSARSTTPATSPTACSRPGDPRHLISPRSATSCPPGGDRDRRPRRPAGGRQHADDRVGPDHGPDDGVTVGDDCIEESYASLDVAGYNYPDVAVRASTARRFPNRVIVGSETYVTDDRPELAAGPWTPDT